MFIATAMEFPISSQTTTVIPTSRRAMSMHRTGSGRWSFSADHIASLRNEIGLNDLAPLPTTGSNSWVVAPEHTDTGFPQLANDPHLELGLPSLWYEIELITGGGGPSSGEADLSPGNRGLDARVTYAAYRERSRRGEPGKHAHQCFPSE